jgi:phosphoglucomutase
MRVLICGGRDFNNFDQVKKVMDDIHAKTPVDLVISGKSGSPEHFEFAHLYAEKVSQIGPEFMTSLSRQIGFVPTPAISNLIRRTLTPYNGKFLADEEKSYNRGNR